MATFNSVTFYPLAEDEMFWPTWEQEPNVNVRHIPYSDTDSIQFSGLGNFKVTVRVFLETDASMASLRASVDGTARTLGDFRGTSYTNTYLVECKDLRRWDSGEKWTCTLTFMRTSNTSSP